MSIPKTEDKRYYDIIQAAMTGNVSKIEAQAKQLAAQDEANIPAGSTYVNSFGPFTGLELYEEVKKAAAEIFSTQDDYASDNDLMHQFIIQYSVLFASILTPALLKYFNAKMEKIYTELYKSIEAEMNQKINSISVQ